MPARVRRSAASMQGNPYGYEHQQERKRLIPLAIGTLCPGGCKRILRERMDGRPLDSDHVPALALHHHVPKSGCCYQRILCARCNRAAGARIGNALRRQRIITRRRPSRTW